MIISSVSSPPWSGWVRAGHTAAPRLPRESSALSPCDYNVWRLRSLWYLQHSFFGGFHGLKRQNDSSEITQPARSKAKPERKQFFFPTQIFFLQRSHHLGSWGSPFWIEVSKPWGVCGVVPGISSFGNGSHQEVSLSSPYRSLGPRGSLYCVNWGKFFLLSL